MLVERYQALAVAVAFSICRERTLAEDVAQDAFVRAFRYLKQLARPESFCAWFLNIVRNAALRAAHNTSRRSEIHKLAAGNHESHTENPTASMEFTELLARVEPKGPRAAGLAKYLVNHRTHGTWWNSTRDTALCIEALAGFLRASGEAEPDLTVEVFLDGRKLGEERITGKNLFTFQGTLVVKGDALEAGAHALRFQRTGKGPLYCNAYLTYFTLEDPITAAGLEVKVERRVYRRVRKEASVEAAGERGQVVSQRAERYEKIPLKDGDRLESGDRVEVELLVESKNDYEYVVIEDLKAAGFEPVEVRSGWTWRGLPAYMELRDERTAFFVEHLPRGRHSLSYQLRAEIPGYFHALPCRAFAMYAPELKGNSDEIRLEIRDRE